MMKYVGKIKLCKPCSTELAETHKIRPLVRGKDEKVICENCKRRRFGAEYFVEPK